MNTRKMAADELKETLKTRAREEQIDLIDLQNRYTIWCENGIWSTNGDHLIFEGSAIDVLGKQHKVEECIIKTSYSRIMILDTLLDQIEIVLPDGKVTVAVAR